MPSWNGNNKTRRNKPTRKDNQRAQLLKKFHASERNKHNRIANKKHREIELEIWQDSIEDEMDEIEDEYFIGKHTKSN